MRSTLGGIVLAVAVAASGVASAAEKAPAGPHKIMRLGNPATSFHRPPLKKFEDLRKMLATKQADIKVILEKAAWNGKIEDFLAAVDKGEVKDVVIQPGTEIPWMSYRKNRKPEVLRKPQGMVWGGRKGFEAYQIQFVSNGWDWTLVVPKPCGNFWITGKEIPPPPPPTLSLRTNDVCVTQPVAVTLTIGSSLPTDKVTLSVDGKQLEAFRAVDGTADKTIPGLAQGRHEIVATIDRLAGPVTASATVKPCPPTCSLTVGPAEIRRGRAVKLDASGSRVAPGVSATLQSVAIDVTRDGVAVETVQLAPPAFAQDLILKKKGSYAFRAVVTDSLGQKSEGECGGTAVATAPPIVPFGAAFFGKERMTHEEDDVELFSGCAALLGAKAGMLAEFADGKGEVEAALGAKISLDDNSDSAMFADLAVNALFEKGFVGGGLSFWDITASETRTVAALVHGGIDLDPEGKFGFVVEGRLPFEHMGDISNNYQFWGGFRIRPARK